MANGSVDSAETRRPPDQLNSLILAAAEQRFIQNGYAGTSMVDIARDAGVSRSVLYRHYASKSALFHATLAQPFLDFVDDWTDEWRSRTSADQWSDVDGMRAFIAGLYWHLAEHREAVRLLLFDDTQLDSHVAAAARAEVHEGFAALMEIVTAELGERGYPIASAEVTIRAVISTIAALLVADLRALPGGEVDGEALVDHLTALFLHGIALRPPGGSD